jgi:clathrin heavy chain
MFECSTGAMIYRQRISDQLPFVCVRNHATDGMIAINRAGQVHAINVDEANLVSFISSAQHIPNGGQLAFKLASRFGLTGADQMFI